MGRGRQKAKQTKVARKLKYFSPETDYSALQKELSGPDRFSPHYAAEEPFEDAEDEGDDFEDDDFEDDGDQDWRAAGQRG